MQYGHIHRTSADPVDYEYDPFLRETRAYCRLQEHGLCKEGHVPDFYGSIENIQQMTKGWEQHLKPLFKRPLPDSAKINAVLIEYIPNLGPFNMSAYSSQRAE
jgi:hypothetical protein